VLFLASLGHGPRHRRSWLIFNVRQLSEIGASAPSAELPHFLLSLLIKMKKYKIKLKGGSEMETSSSLYKEDSGYHLFYQKNGDFGKFLPSHIVISVREVPHEDEETFTPFAIDPN
jgi:hypothetical protein